MFPSDAGSGRLVLQACGERAGVRHPRSNPTLDTDHRTFTELHSNSARRSPCWEAEMTLVPSLWDLGVEGAPHLAMRWTGTGHRAGVPSVALNGHPVGKGLFLGTHLGCGKIALSV